MGTTNQLCDVACAAESLQLKPLVELTTHALARIIDEKSPEELSAMLGMRDDLTEVCGACKNSVC